MNTVTLTCDCKTCAKNAATIGKTLPLTAVVGEKTAARVEGKKRSIHELVAVANHPVFGVTSRTA